MLDNFNKEVSSLQQDLKLHRTFKAVQRISTCNIIVFLMQKHAHLFTCNHFKVFMPKSHIIYLC